MPTAVGGAHGYRQIDHRVNHCAERLACSPWSLLRRKLPSTFTGPHRTSVPFRRKRPPAENTPFHLASANDHGPPLFREAGRSTWRMTDGPLPWRALVGKGKPEREAARVRKEKASLLRGFLRSPTTSHNQHLTSSSQPPLRWNARTFSASLVPQAWQACYLAEAMVLPSKRTMMVPRHGPCPVVVASSSRQRQPVRSRSTSPPTRSTSDRISGRTGPEHRTGCGSAYSV